MRSMHTQVVSIPLEEGLSPNISVGQVTALQLAIGLRHFKISTLLLDHGASVCPRYLASCD